LDTNKILIWDVAFEWLGLGNSHAWWKGLYKLALVSGRIPFMHFSEVRTMSLFCELFLLNVALQSTLAPVSIRELG
jgi:hypothetical protein